MAKTLSFFRKKGEIRDVFLISIFSFMMIIAGLFSMRVFSAINTNFQASDKIPDEAKTMLTQVDAKLPKWIDGAFILFYVVFVIVGIILALQIPSNPVFFPVSIIFFLLLTFISVVFKSIYTRFVLSSVLSAESAKLTIIPFIVDKFPVFSVIVGLVIIGIMVIKR